MIDNQQKRSNNLNEEVYIFLRNMVECKETIEVNYLFYDDNKEKILIDYYLPNGCQKLNYPPKTAIEVKNRITSGTVDRVVKQSDYLYNNRDIFLLVLFSRSIPRSVIPLKRKDKNEKFIVVDFDSLKKTIEHFGRVVFEDDRAWQDKREILINKAKYQFSLCKNTFLLGAGISQDAGLPGWDQLLDTIRADLLMKQKISLTEADAINTDGGNSALIKARYLKAYLERSNYQFVPVIRRALYSNPPRQSKLLAVIAQAIQSNKVIEAITYNYDELLERYLDDLKISYSSVDSQNRPSPIGFPILHVHGFIPKTSSDKLYDKNVVLSEDDYHSLYRDAFHWANVEQMHALLQTTCFFIGLSLKDPSIRRLMDIANMHGSRNAEHFAFLKRDEYQAPQKAEDLFVSMGTSVIWYEQYSDLPQILSSIFL